MIGSAEPGGPGGMESAINTMCASLHPLAIADATALSISVVHKLEKWVDAASLPARQAQILPSAILAAFVAPWLPPERCCLFARAILWTAMVDVFVDDLLSAPDRAIEACLQDCRSVVHNENAKPTDPLALALSTIREDFLTQPAGPGLYSFFQSATDWFLSGQMFERRSARRVATGGVPPGIEEYLEQGTKSIGMHFVTAVVWSTFQNMEISLSAVSSFQGALDAVARAVRLANDLAGYDREKIEGALNAMTVGLRPADAANLLSQATNRGHEQLHRLQVAHQLPALILERQLLCYVRLYGRIDATHSD